MLFGALLGSDWPPRKDLTPFGNGLDVTLGSVGSVFYFFLSEKMILSNSMPFCSGSAIYSSPDAQVGTTWAEKSEPSGPKLQVRGAETVKFVWSVQSCWRGYGSARKLCHLHPDSRQGGGQSPSKALSDNTYDRLQLKGAVFLILFRCFSSILRKTI